MVTISVPNLGNFEGEDERAAMALVRKAKRAAAAENRRRNEASSLAYARAAQRGFFLLDHAWRAKAGNTRMSRAWVIIDPHVGGCGVTVRERDSFWGSHRGHVATYEGVEYDHVGCRVVDVIADGCGWVVAVILRPTDVEEGDDSRDDVVVVGIADGQVALRMLPMTGREMRSLISEPRIEREDAAAE
jgi:hypothetical protein